ncbi:hypothetical protein D0X99_16290 [Algoriphagus lacus]|uniref:Lipocalin-like domain-containing protein n=1 Tax=Algoriphagus lacus TaxID=2056311 RepID=A0A418PNP5_9BACT|nr:hypothetical protein [Algoriphagus lacus]RIW13336.1 hypothetical protein D0X99_16290 [Algoriphagus lacus]
MKKSTLVILSFLSFLGILSCQTEDQDPIGNDDDLLTGEYHVKAKIDGVSKNFPFTFCGNFENEGVFSLLVGGASREGENPEPVITIVLEKSGRITSGDYSVNSSELSAEYNLGEGKESYYASSVLTPKDFSMQITAINNEKVRGTFKGTFKNNQGQTMSITEGTFFLPITLR